MTEGDVIDTTEIAGWFRPGWLTPNPSELEKLASALNIMRVTVHRADAAPPVALGRIKNAIAALSHELPTLIGVDRKTVELMRNSPSIAARLQTNLEVFENLLSAAQHAKELLHLKAAPARCGSWFGDALWIASFLRMLGQRTGKHVSLTKSESPAVAFIDTALKRARVPHKSRDAIAQAMRRYAKSHAAEVTINA
jgi:signal transduction histidine kinase